jgi:uncharacterized protein (DUF1778 family)
MYLNDKTNRITLRLNNEQFTFVKENADIMGVSPSDFLRMVINSTMVLSKQSSEKLKEVFGRENDKSNSNNKL